VTTEIKKRMVLQGSAMLACQPLPEKNLPDFFRITFGCHPLINESDMDRLIATLKQLSNDL
jgi:hypothetical protein